MAMEDGVDRACAVQAEWAKLPVARRLDRLRRLRRLIAAEAESLAALVERPGRSTAMTLAAEILPLIEACRFLEKSAADLLAPRPLGRRGRPLWLFCATAEIRREPFGTVLILAPANYPLLLPGIQMLQAITAGNAVLVKPAAGCSAGIARLVELGERAGLPSGLCRLLDESLAAAETAIAAGPDLVILTGSAETGRAVLQSLAPRLIPAIMELSGNDPLFILPGADIALAARAMAYGLRLNGGATCIAPRRAFVPAALMPILQAHLVPLLRDIPPVAVPPAIRRRVLHLAEEALAGGAMLLGARPRPGDDAMAPLVLVQPPLDCGLLREDVFAPVLSLIAVSDIEQALDLARHCPYALGASIFGPEAAARAVAARIDAGSVTINDVIVPTADPRLPFGGGRNSGFGVTRGAEGLLALTRVKTVSVRRGRFHPHLRPEASRDAALFATLIRLLHGRPRLGPRH